MLKVCVFLLLASVAVADIYLHIPRGSNNRLNEQGTNRDNAARLMDTQNNAKGGYCINVPGQSEYYYESSQLTVEWTAQHGCGTGKEKCNFVLQYMCTDGSDPLKNIRDGTTTTTIPNDPVQSQANSTTVPGLFQYGMHESYAYYQQCSTRSANRGLWLADRNLNSAKPSARYTRQNNNGGQSGFECPEERDYYPYWHPAPWKDIAVLTDDLDLCSFYKKNSQNVRSVNQCVVRAGSDVYYQSANNEAACNLIAGATWESVGKLGGGEPDCLQAPLSRENHLGNVVDAKPFHYNWTLPSSFSEPCILTGTCTCVFRIRYNISTSDIKGLGDSFTDYKYNGINSTVKNNPTIAIEDWNMTLALDTSQHGRTFQDRSHTFSIVKRPGGMAPNARIYNLNVRGKRGNIVQVYPAVEYDFAPTTLEVRKGDYIHFQWVGCDNNPAGNAGEGRDQTDRSNIVQMPDSSISTVSYASFMSSTSSPLFESASARSLMAGAGQNPANCTNTNNNQDPTNCKKLNAAPAYFDGGLYQQNSTGTKRFYSTRNNNFSNRDQKGVIVVNPLLPVWGIVLVSFGSFVFVAAGVIAGGMFYAAKNPTSAAANIFNRIFIIYLLSVRLQSDQLMSSMTPKTADIPQKIAKAQSFKEEGNKFVKSGETPKAFFQYHQALMYINGINGSSDEEKQQINSIKLPIQNNLAMLYVKQEKWEKAIKACTEALQIDKDNVKALFRRGKSRVALGDIDNAEIDLKRAAELDPADKAIKNELILIARKQQEQEKKTKNFYAGMFKKMGQSSEADEGTEK
ncbi:hypothetical protein PROFUN_12764 [Planoprotostelium fungivorum]|uniref:Uncharacterized protein n=1 Tax=Planoprotostelium fungivorum TaxID=1890364 RepID=A0A2P6N5I8_9EUKA|nr:hypothetical protein PROFUN_12764 [Planoprotostelium fungivorum]